MYSAAQLGIEPVPFHTYFAGLFEYVMRVGYRYPYRPLPAEKRVAAAK